MTTPTHFLLDILRQPDEMSQAIDYLTGPGRHSLREASTLVCSSPHVFVTGIGASWNAALSAGSLFQQGGYPIQLQEAAELLHFTAIPRGAVVVAISRTGRSIEIIQLLAQAEARGARVIGITNSEDSPLARESSVAITIPTKLDHAISVNTYSTLVIASSALASSVTADFSAVASSLVDLIREAGRRLEVLASPSGPVELAGGWRLLLLFGAWRQPRNLPRSPAVVGRRSQNACVGHEHDQFPPRPSGNCPPRNAFLLMDRSIEDARPGFIGGQ